MDEPALTLGYTLAWYCMFYAFRQMYDDMYHYYGVIQNIFTAFVFHLFSLTPSMPSNHGSFQSVIYLKLYIAQPFTLASLTNSHLGFLRVFSGLDSSDFHVLEKKFFYPKTLRETNKLQL